MDYNNIHGQVDPQSIHSQYIPGQPYVAVNMGVNQINPQQELPTTASSASVHSFMTNQAVSEEVKDNIIQQIDELKYADKRDDALNALSQQREHFAELAPFIWHSVGTISALLQEIVQVYPLLSPPMLDQRISNKACNVLALLQCVASHKETRQLFLRAHIPLFLYPFLNTVSKGRSFEYLRLTSLGVIGALVKVDDPEVISFLLQTEIIPLCLRIMERGTELSQTVATFIIQKILLDDSGLSHLCQTAERFFAVSTVLNNMVIAQSENKLASTRLLKHIIKCYNRLTENPRASMALAQNMPEIVKEKRLIENLDDNTKKSLKALCEVFENRQQQNVGASQWLFDFSFQNKKGMQGGPGLSGAAGQSLGGVMQGGEEDQIVNQQDFLGMGAVGGMHSMGLGNGMGGIGPAMSAFGSSANQNNQGSQQNQYQAQDYNFSL